MSCCRWSRQRLFCAGCLSCPASLPLKLDRIILSFYEGYILMMSNILMNNDPESPIDRITAASTPPRRGVTIGLHMWKHQHHRPHLDVFPVENFHSLVLVFHSRPREWSKVPRRLQWARSPQRPPDISSCAGGKWVILWWEIKFYFSCWMKWETALLTGQCERRLCT